VTAQLRPCGTPAAYNRHRYRDEPIDDACAQARRRSAWTLRREDYRWLRSNGEPIEAAAQRIGITEKTAKRWEAAA